MTHAEPIPPRSICGEAGGLKARLYALRAIAPRLNAVTDDAATVVAKIEAFLGDQLSLGVPAKSDPFDRVDSTVDGEPTIVDSRIAYGRVNGIWCVHVLAETFLRDASRKHPLATEKTPWSSCSREVKLKSFAMFPDLLAAIFAKADVLAKDACAAMETIEGFEDAFGEV